MKKGRASGGPPVNRERMAWLPLVSLAFFALLVGTFAISCGGASGEQRAGAPAGDESEAAVDVEHPSLGDEGAPVVMTEYADFQ